MASNSLILRITHPDGSIRESVSEQDSVILGSGPAAGIQLEDPAVSGLHLMLKVEKNRVTAIDLGSEHGTCLGDQRIRNPVLLSSGDVLRLGRSQVEVVFGEGRTRPRQDEARPLPLAGFTPGVASRFASALSVARDRGGPAAVPQEEAPPTVRPAFSRAESLVWKLLDGPLPAAARPNPREYVLEAAVLWGRQILAVEHLAPKVPLIIGDQQDGAWYVSAGGVGARHELARAERAGIDLRVPAGAQVEILGAEGSRTAGSSEPVAGPQVLRLELDQRARVRIGSLGFLLRLVKPPPAAPTRKLEENSVLFLWVLLAVSLLVGLLALAIALAPKHPWSAADELESQANVVKFMIKPERHVRPPRAAVRDDKSGAREGAKAKDEEGKLGKPDAKKLEAAPSRRGTPHPAPHPTDMKRIRNLGLLGAINRSGAINDLVGPGGLGTGLNHALGGLRPTAPQGDAKGWGAFGARGNGVGGGGVGLGVAGLGTKGMGSGRGGYGTIDLGGRGLDTTRIIPGKTTVVGGLPRDVIERIIRQHQREIKYCYDIELQKNPSLAGKVAVAFVIDGLGAVSQAGVTETSLNDSTTEQCMLSKIRRWRFPQPVGGGHVTVNFPWVFKPAGGD